jgi:hypothetical protein
MIKITLIDLMKLESGSLMTGRAKTAIQYYSVSFLLYCLEVALISLAIIHLPYNSLLINFLIRVIACSIAFFVYKNYVLRSVDELYRRYILVVALTPLISSMLIFVISTVFDMEFIIIKIGSDAVLSLLGFSFLSNKKASR